MFAGTVLAGACALLVLLPQPLAARARPLGSRTACARYDGLPHGWRDDPRAGMVRVQGGRFVPGSTRGYPEERPTGAVDVASFWIDRTEVTNAQFEAFVTSSGYVTDAERAGGAAVFVAPARGHIVDRAHEWWRFVPGANWRHPEGAASDVRSRGGDPVVQVSAADAAAYARWLGRDLPTEVEWELAARGGVEAAQIDGPPRDAEGRPTANFWQGTFPETNTAEDGFIGRAPVGCFVANAVGAHDLIGNVWEWTTDDWRGGNERGACHGNAAPSGRRAVIKGGSYLCAAGFCVRYRASARHAQERDVPTSHVGFRTVLRE